jgi:hypothetical protein
MRPHKLAYVAHLKAQHTLSDFSRFINTRVSVICSRIFLIMWHSSNVEELEMGDTANAPIGRIKRPDIASLRFIIHRRPISQT